MGLITSGGCIFKDLASSISESILGLLSKSKATICWETQLSEVVEVNTAGLNVFPELIYS